MSTQFYRRSNGAQLEEQLALVRQSAVTEGLMSAVTGLVAVLNDRRQVLTVNKDLLDSLEIHDPAAVLGLRIGEIAGCLHATESSGGCGASKSCQSCGVAIAIAASVQTNAAAEHSCAMEVSRDGGRADLFFRVRCSPVMMSGHRFYLLSLEEQTSAQKSAALQRIFFQDINSLVAGLSATASVKAKPLALRSWTSESFPLTLGRQVAMHKYLGGETGLLPIFELTSPKLIIDTLLQRFSNNPVAEGKTISVQRSIPDLSFSTDSAILVQVLSAMVTNALEATPERGAVKIGIKQEGDTMVFSVANRGTIPPEIKPRIFQRNFSTKAKFGRGVGTWLCKKLGEQLLGGKVSFTTGKSGTVFQISVPREQS